MSSPEDLDRLAEGLADLAARRHERAFSDRAVAPPESVAVGAAHSEAVARFARELRENRPPTDPVAVLLWEARVRGCVYEAWEAGCGWDPERVSETVIRTLHAQAKHDQRRLADLEAAQEEDRQRSEAARAERARVELAWEQAAARCGVPVERLRLYGSSADVAEARLSAEESHAARMVDMHATREWAASYPRVAPLVEIGGAGLAGIVALAATSEKPNWIMGLAALSAAAATYGALRCFRATIAGDRKLLVRVGSAAAQGIAPTPVRPAVREFGDAASSARSRWRDASESVRSSFTVHRGGRAAG